MRYRGTNGDDTLIGTSADDVFRLRRGYDIVDGGGGYDRLIVDYGGQTQGGSNQEAIFIDATGSMSGRIAGDGNSSVTFRDIDSIEFTGSNADDGLSVHMTGDPGSAAVHVDAGGGNDVLTLAFFGTENRSVIVAGEHNTVYARSGMFENFERCWVFFDRGRDFAMGRSNLDFFFGGDGRDDLNGMGGDDFLSGGAHADRLTGGAGSDSFYYNRIGESLVDSPDTITDFSHAEGDTIYVRRIDADQTVRGNQTFTFIDQRAFTGAGGADGEIRQVINGDGTVTLEGDVNHDGLADFAILVTTAQPLVAGDLEL